MQTCLVGQKSSLRQELRNNINFQFNNEKKVSFVQNFLSKPKTINKQSNSIKVKAGTTCLKETLTLKAISSDSGDNCWYFQAPLVYL